MDGTIESIRTGAAIRGTNLWMLLASAALASIGLDTNSTAVIIGAMLVSPLMSPILAVGLAVATVDRDLLFAGLRNLAAAVVFSLGVSVTYFAVTPLGTLTDELAARTVPTLLDVGIALFGGVAGIVAMSRREKTNAIPGVAIATALMPPLCAAGYGIANLSANVFLGAFYLFFLNAVFICLATYLVARLLRFPRHVALDAGIARRFQLAVLAFVVVVTVPSGFLLLDVVERQQLDRNIQRFIRAEIDSENRTALRWSLQSESRPPRLQVYVAGDALETEGVGSMDARLAAYGLDGLELQVLDAGLSRGSRRAMLGEVQSDVEKRLAEMQNRFDEERRRKEQEAEAARVALERLGGDPQELEALRAEISAAFPEVARVTYATGLSELVPDATTGSPAPARIVLVGFARRLPSGQRQALRDRLAAWFEARLDVRPVVVMDLPAPSQGSR